MKITARQRWVFYFITTLLFLIGVVLLSHRMFSDPRATDSNDLYSTSEHGYSPLPSLLNRKKRRLESPRHRPSGRDQDERTDDVNFIKCGKLSYYAIRELEMSKNEAIMINDLLNDFQSDFAIAIKRNIQDDKELDLASFHKHFGRIGDTNFEEESTAFIVNQFAETASELSDALLKDFEAVVGSERALRLHNALIALDSYPGWGKQKLFISIKEDSDSGVHIRWIADPGNENDWLDVQKGNIFLNSRPGLFAEDVGILGRVFDITNSEGGFR